MGKIRTKIIGIEDVEKKQKKEAKVRSEEKKRKKVKTPEIKSKEKTTEVKTETPKEKTEKKEIDKKTTKKKLHGKKYLQAKKAVDKTKKYNPKEAVNLLKKIKYAGFDESVELHINVDETGLKGEVELPHGTGKKLRVKIVDDKILEEIEKGRFDFDVLIAHPSYMSKLVKYARVLGPKGLMPNPKMGTISTKPEEAAKKFEKGSLRWKTEIKAPLLHQIVGKISFEDPALTENIIALIRSVGVSHIREVFVKTTMSPAVKLDVEKIS